MTSLTKSVAFNICKFEIQEVGLLGHMNFAVTDRKKLETQFDNREIGVVGGFCSVVVTAPNHVMLEKLRWCIEPY
jgi:hypothetical protein